MQKNLPLPFIFTLAILTTMAMHQPLFAQNNPNKIVLAIHGGAGHITPENLSEERQQEYKEKLGQALKAGYEVLRDNGTSEEAVVAAISVMEDDPHFNAGKGSVFTHDERNEMDASIMRGKDLMAGAVAGATRTRNPIKAAQAVMNHSEHVMLSGAGANAFAREQGLEMAPPSYFLVDERLERLREIKARENQKQELDHDQYKDRKDDNGSGSIHPEMPEKFGTVGAVALDHMGNLCAGTSTGGMTNKRYNRIGDSPVIGAGTYANNRTCAVSCTGHGEYFIRLAVAHEVNALMEHKGWDVEKSSHYVVHEKLEKLGGEGGLIALDRRGNMAMPFNTPGMFRGYVTADGKITVLIFKQ